MQKHLKEHKSSYETNDLYNCIYICFLRNDRIITLIGPNQLSD